MRFEFSSLLLYIKTPPLLLLSTKIHESLLTLSFCQSIFMDPRTGSGRSNKENEEPARGNLGQTPSNNDQMVAAGVKRMYKNGGGSVSVKGDEGKIKESDGRENKNPEEPAVDVIVNHYSVEHENQAIFIHHFVVKLDPVCDSKAMNRLLKYQLQKDHFGGELIGYDGRKNMFIAENTLKKKSYLHREEIKFTIIPWNNAKTKYVMTLRRVNVLRGFERREISMGCVPSPSPYYLQALQVIMKDGPNSSLHSCAVNKAVYLHEDRPVALKLRGEDPAPNTSEATPSICALKGFVQRLHSTECGLTVNLDSASMAFHGSKNLPEYLSGRGANRLELLDDRTGRPTEQYDVAKNKLEGLYVDLVYPTTYKTYRIVDISNKRAQINGSGPPYVVVRGDPYGEEQSRPEGEHQQTSVLPMEDCVIADGQKCREACRESGNLKTLRDLAGGDALMRYDTIRKNFKSLTNIYESENIIGGTPQQQQQQKQKQKQKQQQLPLSIKKFGIDIKNEMITVTGRLIPEPKLATNIKPRSETNEKRKPRRGEWKLQKVHRSGRSLRPDEWDVIVISNTCQDPEEVNEMIEKVLDKCSSMSINCFQARRRRPVDFSLRVETENVKDKKDLKTAMKVLKRKEFEYRLKDVKFVFCIFQDKLPKSFYETAKRFCETSMGWITQCCKMEHLTRKDGEKTKGNPFASTYRANVALKVNAKLGGINTALDEVEFLKSLFGSEGRVILFGVDVTHPAKNEDAVTRPAKDQQINNDSSTPMDICEVPVNGTNTEKKKAHPVKPNLAVMVASMEWPILGQYYARVKLLPPKATKAEKADELSVMAKELLQTHIENNEGKMPTSAIFFVDRVSDGEFQSLVDTQFVQLRRALKSICPKIKSSLILANRNHRTRFFIKSTDKNGKEVIENAEAGTVVDSKITVRKTGCKSPADFYLASQRIQSKTLERPTHYLLLHDENRLKKNLRGLEKFIFYLCYTFAASTNSVALVPPLLYAHQAASRAGASYKQRQDRANDVHPHRDLINTMYFC